MHANSAAQLIVELHGVDGMFVCMARGCFLPAHRDLRLDRRLLALCKEARHVLTMQRAACTRGSAHATCLCSHEQRVLHKHLLPGHGSAAASHRLCWGLRSLAAHPPEPARRASAWRGESAASSNGTLSASTIAAGGCRYASLPAIERKIKDRSHTCPTLNCSVIQVASRFRMCILRL